MSITNITSGWIKKQESGGLKRYCKRWIVVSGTSLSYFVKDDNSSPLGVIELRGKKITQYHDSDVFKFELTDKDGTVNFICETKTDREKWIDAISCISYGPFGGGMFGSTIETTVKREKLHGGGLIPKIILQCIGYLDNPARLNESGIFRLPGNDKTVKAFKMEYQEGHEPNLVLRGDTHTVGSLLKLYLRSLPDSVIPSYLYEDFVAIILTYDINQTEGLNELRFLINRIPAANYNTLRRLLTFLYKVQTYSASNKMDLNNLAIVFSPTILKNNSGDLQLELSDMKNLKRVTEIMILHHLILYPQDKIEVVEDDIDLDNTDPEELKNLFQVNMIKFRVQAKEKDDVIQSRDNEILKLQELLSNSQNTIREQELVIQHKNLEISDLKAAVQGLDKQVKNYMLKVAKLKVNVGRPPPSPLPPARNSTPAQPNPPPRSSTTVLSQQHLQSVDPAAIRRRSQPVTKERPLVKPRPATMYSPSPSHNP